MVEASKGAAESSRIGGVFPFSTIASFTHAKKIS